MKKIKFFLLGFVLCLTGCSLNSGNMEGIDIYTTTYPTEFITNALYSKHSDIHSIYPNGSDIDKYKLTDKQLNDYSKSDLYIFNGLSNEKDYALKMLKKNSHLRIIDATASMEYDNDYEELWVDPSNFLMIAKNIQSGLEEYINNKYVANDIDKNFEELNIKVSNIDAKINQIANNSKSKTIVTSSDCFKFLSKYGITVYSLEDNKNLTTKTITTVTDLINNGKIDYILIKEDEVLNDAIKDIMNTTGAKTLEMKMLTTLSEKDSNNNEDYFSLMEENLTNLKEELYD